jgi:Cu/Ag efflux protein CusF
MAMMSRSALVRHGLMAALAVTLAGCSSTYHTTGSGDVSVNAAEGQIFVVDARVNGADADHGVVLVEHEPIPEVMPQVMLMAFPVADPGLLRSARAGQTVKLTLQQQSGQLVIIGVGRPG